MSHQTGSLVKWVIGQMGHQTGSVVKWVVGQMNRQIGSRFYGSPNVSSRIYP